MSVPTLYLSGRVAVHAGDSGAIIKTLADNSIDACVCDPPYALVSIVKRFANSPRSEATEGSAAGPYQRTGRGFMGQRWDNGYTAFSVDFWAEVWRVLKPGAHVVAFGGTRTYHRLACAIEDAGFECRDAVMWHYGSGFPKSHDVSKGIDRAAGADRSPTGEIRRASIQRNGDGFDWEAGAFASHPESTKRVIITAAATEAARAWEGWGTALKPATEIIFVGRKPLSEGTVAANCLKWGTSAINVDACRVGFASSNDATAARPGGRATGKPLSGLAGIDDDRASFVASDNSLGRWPANLVHDGSVEVLAAFPESDGGGSISNRSSPKTSGVYGEFSGGDDRWTGYADSGSAARFFYSAKADSDDRIGSKHPTVKPVDLMQWLCRLVCPPGGTILDPFAGTGTTGAAAWREGFNAVLIEREAEYLADIARRMKLCLAGPDERARESIKARNAGKPDDHGPLFVRAAE